MPNEEDNLPAGQKTTIIEKGDLGQCLSPAGWLILIHHFRQKTHFMSTKTTLYLSDLHFEHQQWLKELEFWEDEIALYNRRLGEIIVRYTDPAIKAEMEHFQNQFIRHDEVIDILKHDVRKHESQLVKYAQDHPIAIDRVHFDDHTGLRDRMETQRKIYADLKTEFYTFLSRNM